MKMISQGAEISIAGGVVQTEHALTSMTFSFYFFCFLCFFASYLLFN